MLFSFVLAGLAATCAASAQSISNVTTTCQNAILSLAISGDAATCLALNDIVPVLSSNDQFVSALDTYLGKLCSNSTPGCSNSTLSSAKDAVTKGCAEDLKSSTSAINLVVTVLDNYDEVYAGACSKITASGQFCLTETLNNLQTDLGQNISLSYVSGVLSGNGDSMSQLAQTFQNGNNLCTGCVAGLVFEATKVNQTLVDSSVGSAVASQCGADFGKSAPTEISLPTPPATSAGLPPNQTVKLGGSPITWNLAPVLVLGASFVASLVGAAAVF